MSENALKLLQVIDRYLEGGQPYMEFHRVFMDLFIEGGLSEVEELQFEPAYDLVYMGADDVVAPEDEAVGVIPEPKLKVRLKEFRERNR